MNRRFHASGWVVGAGLALAGHAAAQGGLIDPNEAKIGTRVSFQTDVGDITVGLFDTTTPQTVDNFLNYVNDGDLDGGFFHRLVDGFVLQGGGFGFLDAPVSGGQAGAEASITADYALEHLVW